MSKAKQNKMWSGRFKKQLDPAFDLWQRSFAFDQQLISEEITASIGYAKALQDVGVLTKSECMRITKALAAISEDVHNKREEFIHDADAEDVHHYVEIRLVERVGSIGKKLHTGRSRNEQIATDLRLYINKWAEHLQRGIGELAKSFLYRAEQAGTKHTMPAYTHLQRAEPVLVSHWLLAYFEMLMRDIQRLAYVRNTLDECPLGSGAIAGSTVTLDRNKLAVDLGFARPTHNSIDATSDRDFAIEYLHALTLFSLHMTRWAEELILFSTREFGFVVIPDEYSTGSSAMPQKKNPDALELIRGMSGRIFGSMNALMVTLKGLPLAYNKDLQEMQRPILSATREINAMLPIAVGVIQGLEFNTAKMLDATTKSHMNAMAAATYLSSKGLPFREAHEQIGKAVQCCLQFDCELEDLPQSELNKIGRHFGPDFKKNLTLKAVLQCHDNLGGTAPSRVNTEIKQAHQRLRALGIR